VTGPCEHGHNIPVVCNLLGHSGYCSEYYLAKNYENCTKRPDIFVLIVS